MKRSTSKTSWGNFARILLINISVFSILLLIVIVFAEICLRIFFPQSLLSTAAHDSLLGWKNIPSSSKVYINKDYEVTVNINSKGLRDKEYAYQKPDGIRRILVLGDSFTWGGGVEDNETYPNVLESLLNGNVEVINTGVNGYGTDQEYLYLKTEGYKYEPDIVLLAFCFNDVENNLLDFDRGGLRQKPLFTLYNGALKLENTPVPRLETEEGYIASLKLFLRNNFHFYHLLSDIKKRLTSRYVERPEDNVSENLQIARRSLGFKTNIEAVYFPYFKEISNSIVAEGWNITRKLLNEIAQISKNIGAEFIIVLIPSHFEIYQQELKTILIENELNPENFDPSKLSEIFRNIQTEDKIRTIILSENFKKHYGESLYFVHDKHWSMHGHKLAAETIHSYLMENEELYSRVVAK